MCEGSTIGLPYESSRAILRYRADGTPCYGYPRYGFGQRKKSHDDDHEQVNSCPACDARQVTLDGKMSSIVTGADASVWG